MSTKSSSQAARTDLLHRVIHYHRQTKHHFNRYARSLGYLDWVNQPDPFRRFEGTELISLPLLKVDEEPLSPAYEAIYEMRTVTSQPVNVRTLSRFFEYALALSAWKKAGESEWALRSNPSSGNLHPTEGYVVLSQTKWLDLQPGLYHYAPKEHGLERRAEFPADLVDRLLRPFPQNVFLFGLTSIHWREAWKYGERAFRYCNHDVGHAIGSTRIAAATLGWNMTLLDSVDQDTVATLLGTDRKEDFGGGTGTPRLSGSRVASWECNTGGVGPETCRSAGAAVSRYGDCEGASQWSMAWEGESIESRARGPLGHYR